METKMATPTLEQRIRAIEDRLEIYNLIASHPPSADSAAHTYIKSIFVEDAVLDLGGTKTASGNQAISEMPQKPEHHQAIRGGLAHFAGLPHVTIDGDRAVVTSYLQIIAAHEFVAVVTRISARASRGFWLGHPNREQPRDPQGQKIKREENDEAGKAAKRALHNQPGEIGREATPKHENDVVDDH